MTVTKDCSGCKAGFYCPGNSQELRCGFDDTTRYMYSFGLASQCTTCPQGWVSKTLNHVFCFESQYRINIAQNRDHRM